MLNYAQFDCVPNFLFALKPSIQTDGSKQLPLELSVRTRNSKKKLFNTEAIVYANQGPVAKHIPPA